MVYGQLDINRIYHLEEIYFGIACLIFQISSLALSQLSSLHQSPALILKLFRLD